ncbi:MAG: fibronectin type III domain-containing protein [Gammaproteobacteria bacterium]|nr:fibronectin type III domain-containing protein [Gammaproteobacteria bacterium]
MLLASCSDSADTPANTSSDAIAPTFSGASSSSSVTSASVNISWMPGSDNTTPANLIKYNIYSAMNSSGQNFTGPEVTVSGSTSATVTGLSSANIYYFVVRAEDEAGNEDTNNIEISATTSSVTVVSFATDVQPIFNSNCLNGGCHDATSPAGNLNLTAGAAYDELVGTELDACTTPGNKRLVTASDVNNSYLINTLLGTELCGSLAMPKAGLPLSDNDIQVITNWINESALNN